MSMKREIDKAVGNLEDTVKEAGHRTNAGMERENRREAGDTMSTRQKLASIIREGKESTSADLDRAKRDIRNNT